MFRPYSIFCLIKQEGLQGYNFYVIWYMATGTKLQGVVILGIRHGVNDIFAFWDVKQVRLRVTDFSEQPIAPSSRVQQSICQYMLCDIPEERSTLINRRIPKSIP